MIRATRGEGVLLAVSLAVVLVGGVAAATRGPDETPNTSLTQSSPGTESSAAPGGAAPGTVPGPGAPGASPDAGVPPAPRAGSAPAAQPPAQGPVSPASASPPAPGTYTYSSTRGENSSESDFVVSNVSSEGGVVRQREKGAAFGFSGEAEVVWRPDGKVIESRSFEGRGQNTTCDLEPDYLEYKLPLAVGVSWSASSACTVTYSGADYQMIQSGDYRVVGAERVAVREVPVDVWVIEAIVTIRTSGALVGGESTTRAEEKQLYSPGHGLVVRAEGAYKSGQSETPFRRDLLSLTPGR